MNAPLSILAVAMSVLPLCAEIRAGRAAVEITPPLGMPMQGYYYVRLNEGTHDSLWSKAIVIASGERRAALVALDLGSIPRPFVERARSLIRASTGIADVMISATHTHTGPELSARLKGVDAATESLAREYYEKLPRLIAESVEKAAAELQPVTISAGIGEQNGISFIRRYRMKDGTVGWNPGKRNPNIVAPIGKIDPDVAVVEFDGPRGEPLAAYVNFANHLDTVGGMKYSADYPYSLARVLAEVKAPSFLTVFTIGCAGNINHIDVSHSRPQKGDAEAARIGTILGGTVLSTMERLTPVSAAPLTAASRTLELTSDGYAQEDVAKAKQVVAAYGKPNASPFLEQVHAFKVLEIEERQGKPFEAEVQVIALGREVAWVGLPGEIFTELGKTIKLESPFPVTIVAELANGNLGYVPDRRAYPQGAYEVVSTRLMAGSGEKLAAAAIEMLIDAFQAPVRRN